MGARNRKPVQLALPFAEEGEALRSDAQGSRTPVAPREPPTLVTHLMDDIVSPDNMRRALRRVVGNKGAAGVDGMTVNDLTPYLMLHYDS